MLFIVIEFRKPERRDLAFYKYLRVFKTVTGQNPLKFKNIKVFFET